MSEVFQGNWRLRVTEKNAGLPQELDGLPVDVIEFQKPVENEQIRQAIEQAIAVKDRVADSWLQQQNVTGIGVGYKVKDATTTHAIAIQIFVQQKLSAITICKNLTFT